MCIIEIELIFFLPRRPVLYISLQKSRENCNSFSYQLGHVYKFLSSCCLLDLLYHIHSQNILESAVLPNNSLVDLDLEEANRNPYIHLCVVCYNLPLDRHHLHHIVHMLRQESDGLKEKEIRIYYSNRDIVRKNII